MKKEQVQKESSLLSGSLWDKILMFALPLAASSILQQLFNSADVAVVGHYAGSQALGAVGSNGPIINLLINLFVGLSIGANVVISRFIGENNEKKVQTAVHTSVLVALISGVFLACVGILVSRPMLNMMGSPDDIIDLAALYLKIYFLGMPFLMLYNFEAAILRSKGDTKRPLFALFIAGVANVILNLFFVIVCHLSVAGVAIATVISQVISSGFLFRCLLTETGSLKLDLKKLRIDWPLLLRIAKVGLPAGLQGMVFSASNVCIQSAMNHLGSTAVSASAAALNFEIFVYYLINSFAQASVTFTSQNYGAAKLDRCTGTVRWCLLLGSIFTVAMSAVFVLFGNQLIYFYTSDPEVAALAVVRIRIVVTFEVISLAMEIFSGSMRGFGYSLVPALLSIAGACGVRILWIYTIYQGNPTFSMLLAIYPISWAITAAAVAVAYLFVKKRAAQKITLAQ